MINISKIEVWPSTYDREKNENTVWLYVTYNETNSKHLVKLAEKEFSDLVISEKLMEHLEKTIEDVVENNSKK